MKQDDDCLKALEETADRLKRAELERDSLKLQVQLLEARDKDRLEQIANAKEQAQFWKDASKTGDKIDTNNLTVIQMLREQVGEFRGENLRLRQENDKLRSSRDFRTMVGFGAGFGTGYFLKK